MDIHSGFVFGNHRCACLFDAVKNRLRRFAIFSCGVLDVRRWYPCIRPPSCRCARTIDKRCALRAGPAVTVSQSPQARRRGEHTATPLIRPNSEPLLVRVVLWGEFVKMPHMSARKSYLAVTVSALVIGTVLSLGTMLVRNVVAADRDCRITSGTAPPTKLTMD